MYLIIRKYIYELITAYMQIETLRLFDRTIDTSHAATQNDGGWAARGTAR